MKKFKQLIGSTSWVIPGTYYENAKLISKYVDFVELLVYTWDEETKKLFEEEIRGLEELQKEEFFYTVHLPTDNAENVLKALEYFERSDLNILNYVLHPLDNLDEKVLKNKKVSLENLKEKVVFHNRLTFDIGHHLLGQKVPRDFKNFVEFHIMGVDLEKGKDHLPLDKETCEIIFNKLWFDILKVPLVCFEIFSFEKLLDSIETYKGTLFNSEFRR